MQISKKQYCFVLFLLLIGGVVIFNMNYFFSLGIAHLVRPRSDGILSDQTFEMLSISNFSEAYIAIPQNSKSPLGKGYLEYQENILKDKNNIAVVSGQHLSLDDVNDLATALRPVTLIKKDVRLEIEKVDCVFYCWPSRRPIWLYIYIDPIQINVRFYYNGNLYQGGECERFVSHVNRLWLQHNGANNIPVKVLDGGLMSINRNWKVRAVPVHSITPGPELPVSVPISGENSETGLLEIEEPIDVLYEKL